MKPNVLFITADQWRGDAVGYAGHPRVKTPVLDALASESTVFLRHFGQATPCSPSRACLYTGLYQMTTRVVRNGTPLDQRHDNIAKMMRRAGYDSTLLGYTDQAVDPRTTSGADPWLTTYEGVLPGFTPRLRLPEENGPWLSWLASRGHPMPADKWDVYLPVSGPSPTVSTAPPRYSAEETETAFITNEFLRFASEQKKPWFAHVSFLRPHPPFIVPEPYNTLFDPADSLPFNRLATAADDAALHPLVAYIHGKTKRAEHYVIGAGPDTVASWSDADFRALRAIYWGMIAEVDAQLGRIVAGLKASGAWDNTILVFTADHGEMMGDHWALGKFGFFDPATHVPLLIRDPRRAGGHRVARFTESIDIVPTILELVGAENPGFLDGRALTAYLDGGEPAEPRDAAIWEYDFREVATGGAQRYFDLPLDALNMATIRTERFKYVHFGGLPPLLFDLVEDPAETIDRSRDPSLAGVRLELAERMLDWRARHLDRRLTGMEITAGGLVEVRR